MKRNTTLLGLSTVALTLAFACSKSPQVESTALQETAVEPVAEAAGAAFDCEGVQLLAQFEDGAVTLDLEEGKVALPRTESESGDVYSDGTTTFRTEGSGATLERPSGTVTCVAQPLRSEEAEAGPAEPEAAPAE